MKIIISILIICFGLLTLQLPAQNDYPIPEKNKELLFYIQRNHNKNTIIYDANFDRDGNLIDNKPINVYWVRYEEQGQKMELRAIEKKFAYGLEFKKIKSHKHYYQIELVAYDKRKLWLKQEAPYKAAVYMMINGKLALLERQYIFADNSGLWPDVKYIELFGKDIVTNENRYEKIINN
ncbi:MAG: DUF4833 domain-containing protein [Bacteroidales bacterium]|nr:DUF4833 domain-containing protein [Bacteroidales bacterium]